MSIPSYQEMKRPILEYLADVQEPVKLAVLREGLAKRLCITEKALEERLPGGGKRFSNRVGWAVHELKAAGLVESVRHGYSKITQSGRGTLRNSDDASRKLEQAKEKNSADDKRIPDGEKIKSSLVEMAVEGWRFSRLFSRVLDKLDASESPRYVTSFDIFERKLTQISKTNADPSKCFYGDGNAFCWSCPYRCQKRNTEIGVADDQGLQTQVQHTTRQPTR